MQPAGAQDLRRRVIGLRGRIVASRALEDLQPGLFAGVLAALALGLVRWAGLAEVSPGAALSAATAVALGFPLVGLLVRRLSDQRVAAMVDERLGLAERVATALALEKGTARATPLAPLVLEDASRSLAAAPPGALRRAFLPRVSGKHLGGAAAGLLLAVLAFQAEPRRAREEEKPKDIAAAHKDRKEKEEAQKAARRVEEQARSVEDSAKRTQAALKALAAEVRRQAEEQARQNPTMVKAMAGFQKMGEVSRERMEMLAGVDPSKLAEMKADGRLSKMDPALKRLLERFGATDAKGLKDRLSALDRELKGLDPKSERLAEDLADLKAQIDSLADALEKDGAALSDRPGLRKSLGMLGDPEKLRKISEALSKLMDTLQKKGFESCKKQASDKEFEPLGDDEPLELTDEQLQAMLDRLEELQKMAELGQLSFCQNCGLTGGT